MKIRTRLKSDEGTMPVVAAIFAIAFVGAMALFIQHHQNLAALSLARETSFNAARAGGQQLDEAAQGTTGIATINPEQARTAAAEIVADVDGANLQSVDVNGDSITVVVAVESDGILDSKTFTGEAVTIALDPNA